MHTLRNLLRSRRIARFEVLEPRLALSASPIDGRAYVDVGPSDNVAWDQPRVTVQLLTQNFPQGTEPPQNIIVGPNTFNSWLLDTGANTTLAFQTAVNDMREFDPKYETAGLFDEIGVGGSQLFDISIPYRFDFAGSQTFERNTLQESSIISNPNSDVSIFGPWGIVGMPAMTERYTTLDFTPWTTVSGFDLFMNTDFPSEIPEPLGPRYTISVDNRVNFSPEGSVVSGNLLPMWADLPFLTGVLKNNSDITSGNFLFDTGAQVSIISSEMAFNLGLDSNADGVLDHLDANFAREETVGGIGGTTQVPVFLIDEVHIPTDEGVDMVWTDLQWLILDIVEGIDGVFGFDNITSGWIEAFGIDGQSGFIMQSHLDFAGWDTTGQGKIHFDLNPELHTFVDPNGPGAIVEETGGNTTVSEDGLYNDTYTIRLTQRPNADVTVSLEGFSSQASAFDTDNPANEFVVFTPSNWNIPQTVTVRALDDSAEESYHRTYIRNIASSADPAYDSVGMPRISVGIVDDDFPGIMLIPTDGATEVVEGGGSDYYDIVLTTATTADVDISFEHIANQLTVEADATGLGFLTFTPTNWAIPQRVKVTAIDDNTPEGKHTGFITHRVQTTDEGYQQAFVLQERVTIFDEAQSDQIGPSIRDIIVGSTSWASEFLDTMQSQNANGLGKSLVGSWQLDNLTQHNIDKVYIQFNEDVSSSFNAANVLLRGTNVPDYDATFEFGVDGINVGTLTLNTPIAADALMLTIFDSLTDAAGNPLDGEWIDAGSSVSGDGSNGGQFNFRIDVLPGDVNQTDGVNFSDARTTYRNIAADITVGNNYYYDVNGSGAVNFSDAIQVFRMQAVLPEPPGIPSKPAGVGFGGGAVWVDVPNLESLSRDPSVDSPSSGSLNSRNPFLVRAVDRAQELLAQQADADSRAAQKLPLHEDRQSASNQGRLMPANVIPSVWQVAVQGISADFSISDEEIDFLVGETVATRFAFPAIERTERVSTSPDSIGEEPIKFCEPIIPVHASKQLAMQVSDPKRLSLRGS